VELARTNARKRACRENATFVPHPVFGKTPLEMRHDIEGKDPVTGRLVMRESKLTKPLTAEEKAEWIPAETINPRLFCLIQRTTCSDYLEHGMTDYLPIILLTEEKVAAMLKGTSHRRDEVVGRWLEAPSTLGNTLWNKWP
jgi:hypothetical protein